MTPMAITSVLTAAVWLVTALVTSATGLLEPRSAVVGSAPAGALAALLAERAGLPLGTLSLLLATRVALVGGLLSLFLKLRDHPRVRAWTGRARRG